MLVPEGHVAWADGVEEAGGPGYATKVLFEAALQGPAVPGVVAQVPLARHEGGVVMALEGFRNGDALAVEVALVGGWPVLAAIAVGRLCHVSDAHFVGMEPGH